VIIEVVSKAPGNTFRGLRRQDPAEKRKSAFEYRQPNKPQGDIRQANAVVLLDQIGINEIAQQQECKGLRQGG